MATRASDADFFDALDLIRHRGPDGGSVWGEPGVRLGHRRLAIIDLARRADQPMRQGELVIVFNGEIYNFRELRAELSALGHTFNTSSDTEVLLQAWQRWGPDCLTRLEGMFAFALWDGAQEKLYLARDRYGEKPLFVHESGEGIAFASEMPPLIRLAGGSIRENNAATGLFFLYSYIPAPHGALHGVSQLEPGCWMEWSTRDGVRRHRYYSLQVEIVISAAQLQPPYAAACRTLKSMLRDAVRQRVETADVPVASLLSGGIDSSIVTILAAQAQVSDHPMSVYSLGFPEDTGFDETDFAKAVTATLPNVRHHIIEATEDSMLRFAGEVLDRLGEPYADASILPTSLLCSKIEEKVALGGDAADELFAGYGTYPAIVAGARLPAPVRGLLGLMPRHPNPPAISNARLRAAALFHRHLRATPLQSYLSWRSYADMDVLAAMGIDTSAAAGFAATLDNSGASSLRDVQALDLAFNLPNDMLKKVDHAAMFHSIEVRLPFLDSKLVHWALGLPDEYRLSGSTRKRILRDAFADVLPGMVLTRGKMGFLLPIRRWFREGKLYDELDALLSAQTVLDGKAARAVLSEHARGRADNSVLLWSMYVYLRWLGRLPVWAAHKAPPIRPDADPTVQSDKTNHSPCRS
jgi:asparagine synthase (glutamine-hydrolysing)